MFYFMPIKNKEEIDKDPIHNSESRILNNLKY